MDSGTLVMDESGFPIGQGSDKPAAPEPDELKALRIENAKLKMANLELQSVILQHQHNEQASVLRKLGAPT